MAAGNPTQAWNQLVERLTDGPGVAFPEKFSVLDHLLFGVVQEGASPSLSLEAYKNLVNGFFNFNEMRVAHPGEFVALLEGVPDAPTKAQRMLDILRFVFDTTVRLRSGIDEEEAGQASAEATFESHRRHAVRRGGDGPTGAWRHRPCRRRSRTRTARRLRRRERRGFP